LVDEEIEKDEILGAPRTTRVRTANKKRKTRKKLGQKTVKGGEK